MARSESDEPVDHAEAPLALDAASLQRVVASRGAGGSLPPALVLAARVFGKGGDLVERLAETELVHPSESERVRLTTKGRVLFEHCLERRSEVCVVGFLEHRLSVQPAETGFVVETIAWLTEEACELTGEEHELACSMIAAGVALLEDELQ